MFYILKKNVESHAIYSTTTKDKFLLINCENL